MIKIYAIVAENHAIVAEILYNRLRKNHNKKTGYGKRKNRQASANYAAVAKSFETCAFKKKPSTFVESFCGISWDRTSDTRIFSPLLYRLSYDTDRLRTANVAFFLFIGSFF
jgi:hypothetical protein